MSLFAKQQYLLDYTLSSLLRHKGKNLALLAVYTLIVFLLASVMLFTHSLRKEASLILQQSPEIILQRLIAGRQDLIPAEYLNKLGKLRGVTSKRGRLWGYFFDPAVEANYTLMATNEKGLKSADVKHPEQGEVAIGSGIARARGIGIGDFFSFYSPAQKKPFIFNVKEVLENNSELVSTDLILMSEESFRCFFGISKDFYTDLVLSVKNPREIQKIAQKIAVKLPNTRPILREEILRTYDSIFSWRQGIVFVLLIGAILSFVIFAWDKASGLSAEEKRELGILKAIGWNTDDILKMKFWEGAMMSLAAFFLGYLLAYVHVFYGSASLFEPVLKGWAILYPDFRPTPYVDGLQITTLFFFTVFPYTVATIIPIWRAAVTDPDAIMR
jgi:ABC-type lipoprotein release transport system permease subunit